jgi:hypothetical protein
MSILDDAIREHLELKRQHGADESELKKLEDEAFGPPGRPEEPDPLAEAPTEFMAAPDAVEATESAAGEAGGRRINIADLQEAPPQPTEAASAPTEDAAQSAPPAEEPTAMEHEVIADTPPEPPAPETEAPGPETEERHAIAEQPTEFFDVESELDAEGGPPAEAESPSDEEIVEAELTEPKLAPAEPETEIYAARTEPAEEAVEEEDEEDEEFWSDQRLSDELDQALESPLTEEHEIPGPAAEPAPPAVDEEGEDEAPAGAYDPDTGHEDVLEDTPEFLEDAPEDDELWFEQKPPKDFDFDD